MFLFSILRKFTFKKPGGSLSLQKAKPPSHLLSKPSGQHTISHEPVPSHTKDSKDNEIDLLFEDTDDDMDVMFLSQTKPVKAAKTRKLGSAKPKKVFCLPWDCIHIVKGLNVLLVLTPNLILCISLAILLSGCPFMILSE